MSPSTSGANGGAASSGYYARLQRRDWKNPSTTTSTNSNSINNSSSPDNVNSSPDVERHDRQVAMQARRVANKLYVASADKAGDPRDGEGPAEAGISDAHAQDKLSAHDDSTADDRAWAMVSQQVAHILHRSTGRPRPDIGTSTSADLFRLLDPSADDSLSQQHSVGSAHDRRLLREQRWEANVIQSGTHRKHVSEGPTAAAAATHLEATVTPSTHTNSSSSSSSSSPLPPMDHWSSEEDESDDKYTHNISIEDTQLMMQLRQQANNIHHASSSSHHHTITLPTSSIPTLSRSSLKDSDSMQNYSATNVDDTSSHMDRNWVKETRLQAHSISISTRLDKHGTRPLSKANHKKEQSPVQQSHAESTDLKLDETSNRHRQSRAMSRQQQRLLNPETQPRNHPAIQIPMTDPQNTDITPHHPSNSHSKPKNKASTRPKGQYMDANATSPIIQDVGLATNQFLAQYIQSSMPEKTRVPQNHITVVSTVQGIDKTIDTSTNRQTDTPQSPNITTLTSDQLFLHLDASPPIHTSRMSENSKNDSSLSMDKKNQKSHVDTFSNIQNPPESILQRMIPAMSPSQHPVKSSPTIMPPSIRSIVAAFSCVHESQDITLDNEDTLHGDPRPHKSGTREDSRITIRDSLVSTSKATTQSVSHDIFNMCDPICNNRYPHDIPSYPTPMHPTDDTPMNPLYPIASPRMIVNAPSMNDDTSIFTFITKSSEAAGTSAQSSVLDLSFPTGKQTMDMIHPPSTVPDKSWTSISSAVSISSSTKFAKKMNRKNLLDEMEDSIPSEHIHTYPINREPSSQPDSNKQPPIDWELEWIKSQLQIKHMIATNVVEWFRNESDMANMARHLQEMKKKQEQYQDEIQKLMQSSHEGDMSDTLSGTQSDFMVRKEELQRENFKLKAKLRKMKEEATESRKETKDSSMEFTNPDRASETLTLRAELVEMRSQITDLKAKNMELHCSLDKEKAWHDKMQRQLENDKMVDEKTEALQKEIHSLQFVAKIKADSLAECKNQIVMLEKNIKDLTLQSKADAEAYQKEIENLKALLIEQGPHEHVSIAETEGDENYKEKIVSLEQELAMEREKSDQKPKIGGRVEARVLAYKKKYEQCIAKYELCLCNEKLLNEKIIELEHELLSYRPIKESTDRDGMVIHENLSDLATEKGSNLNQALTYSDDDMDERTAPIHSSHEKVVLLQAGHSSMTNERDASSSKNLVDASFSPVTSFRDATDLDGMMDLAIVNRILKTDDSETPEYALEQLTQSLDEALRRNESLSTTEKNLRAIISSLEHQILEQRKEATESKCRSEELSKALDETDDLLKQASLTAEEKQRLEKEVAKLSTELIDSRAKARRMAVKTEVDLSRMRDVESQLRQEIIALHEQVDKLSHEKEEQERLALSDDGIAEQLRIRDEKIHEYQRDIEKLHEESKSLEAKQKDEMNHYTIRLERELSQLRQSNSDLTQSLQTVQIYVDQLKSDYDRLFIKSEMELKHFIAMEESLRSQLSRISTVNGRTLHNLTKVQNDVIIDDEFEIEMIDTVDEAGDLTDGIYLNSREQCVIEQSLRAQLQDAQCQSEKWKSLYETYVRDTLSSHVNESPLSNNDESHRADTVPVNNIGSNEVMSEKTHAMLDDSPIMKMHDYGPTQYAEEIKDSLALDPLKE